MQNWSSCFCWKAWNHNSNKFRDRLFRSFWVHKHMRQPCDFSTFVLYFNLIHVLITSLLYHYIIIISLHHYLSHYYIIIYHIIISLHHFYHIIISLHHYLSYNIIYLTLWSLRITFTSKVGSQFQSSGKFFRNISWWRTSQPNCTFRFVGKKNRLLLLRLRSAD